MKPSTTVSTAAQLNPAAASTDGPAAGCEPAATVARAARVGGAAAAGDAEGGCSGPTNAPAGAALPSAAKPQSSSFFAEAISVSADGPRPDPVQHEPPSWGYWPLPK